MLLVVLSARYFHLVGLSQFRSMILCVMPNSWPIMDYADYGCYCGSGGSGDPVDDLDRSEFTPLCYMQSRNSSNMWYKYGCFVSRRCCQVHDQCYSDAMQHPDCWPILDHPYIEFYAYSCNKGSRTVTCGSE